MSLARRCYALLLGSLLLGISMARAPAAEPEGASPVPTEAEAAQLLADEPMTMESWPEWRERLLGWIGDRSQAAQALFDTARQFVGEQASDDGQLPEPLADDAFAWYLLGSAQLVQTQPDDYKEPASRAEKSLRRSVADPHPNAEGHRLFGEALYDGLRRLPQRCWEKRPH